MNHLPPTGPPCRLTQCPIKSVIRQCQGWEVAGRSPVFLLNGGPLVQAYRKVFGSFLALAAAVLTFGNWRQSPLHRRVCGPDTPYPYNVRWMIEGKRTIDNWPARLCGCTPPPGYSDREERARIVARAESLRQKQPDRLDDIWRDTAYCLR